MQMCALPPVDPLAASAAADARGRRDDGTDRDGGHACWRAHDVLRLRRLPARDGEPEWVRDAFLLAPFAVVRRAPAAPDFVAVGIRGASRAQRYGTWAADADVEFAVAPEALAASDPSPGRERLPAFAALATLQRSPGALASCVWGPAGSVGFELATRTPAVTASSDLDLLIRAPDRLRPAVARRLFAELRALAERAGIRVDVQVDTPAGGVALAELAAGKPRVMARAIDGPLLVADPWAAVTTGSGAADAAADADADADAATTRVPHLDAARTGAAR
ncbi:malonate decarboxylase holo-ACP synthase [Paraburkholderia solisilvae]|uniref:Phosphoribosyl-dephospho-CoA transferase n=1 Tax=Paraburkholderia solisilvae TaxID=624376 RepID=A0A6J5ESH9_9BURK|nr:malonate decarboxylase holo-ACP synthase [Paraburkholderia solisilvae]CAB3769153.1 Phosphoribosyl-dephospho-CoA transferase [Paraburkholderia solisilvae]